MGIERDRQADRQTDRERGGGGRREAQRERYEGESKTDNQINTGRERHVYRGRHRSGDR